jgi:hypothetical protein
VLRPIRCPAGGAGGRPSGAGGFAPGVAPLGVVSSDVLTRTPLG